MPDVYAEFVNFQDQEAKSEQYRDQQPVPQHSDAAPVHRLDCEDTGQTADQQEKVAAATGGR